MVEKTLLVLEALLVTVVDETVDVEKVDETVLLAVAEAEAEVLLTEPPSISNCWL